MKTFAFLSVIRASEAFRANCPDQELGDLCESNCLDGLSSCLSDCLSDAGCQEQCYTSFNNCSFRCPCNIFCPDGCKDCENEICPDDTCPDQNLADECEAKCSETLEYCLNQCSDPSCQENCFIGFNNCSFRCPCNIFCPNGCEGCENEVCGGGGGETARRLVHLGDAGGEGNTAFFVTDEFGELFEKLFLALPDSGLSSNTSLRNAGFAVFRNEIFAFGGEVRDSYKTRILKLEGCEFKVHPFSLVRPFHSTYGSIAVWDGGDFEEEGVYICFGTYDYRKYCERFNGTSSERIASTNTDHQSAAMCVYGNELLAIGGINSYSQKSAYGFTAAKLDNNTIMMFPGKYGKAAYRTIWNGEQIEENRALLTGGELSLDNVMHPIVYEGNLECPEIKA
ncbi:Oidioi.mRNA.OKI2018_I69.chr1.g3710.t1.cds [Oikopleura dioica]|uniref:Oidioi.mRNA.OKI2018_I69.chr1.g3710.t1.cds n=1 Tax=Oikopleura dioica TaxID=34765 RepID=A0ABN7SZA1_OIKDI|nr:Oidioi.mRNA.OKI2018_I69.chr1.g3710.t1.cds [Oikopleura dioica]